jgi:hypothetical protein
MDVLVDVDIEDVVGNVGFELEELEVPEKDAEVVNWELEAAQVALVVELESHVGVDLDVNVIEAATRL